MINRNEYKFGSPSPEIWDDAEIWMLKYGSYNQKHLEGPRL